MSEIWADNPDGSWEPLSPTPFGLEGHLQEMVFRSVGMLPLSGRPTVVALAREVLLPVTKGRVDVVAVEADGTLVLVEVKLKQNQEARKAVVAQLLSYAASLRGSTPEALLAALTSAGFEAPSVADALQDVAVGDADAFDTALTASLAEGRFRLVLVLDEAPGELIALVGYLEAISGGLLAIDLITVSAYEVGGRKIAVPQRVDPKHYVPQVGPVKSSSTPDVVTEQGPELFASSVAGAPEANQQAFQEMLGWATELAAQRVANLVSRQGPTRTVLTLRVVGEDAGLASLWNDSGAPYLWLHGTVLDRRAPRTAAQLEALLGKKVGFRVALKWADVSTALRETLLAGYREAATR